MKVLRTAECQQVLKQHKYFQKLQVTNCRLMQSPTWLPAGHGCFMPETGVTTRLSNGCRPDDSWLL